MMKFVLEFFCSTLRPMTGNSNESSYRKHSAIACISNTGKSALQFGWCGNK